jgi:hypothetical protein
MRLCQPLARRGSKQKQIAHHPYPDPADAPEQAGVRKSADAGEDDDLVSLSHEHWSRHMKN